MTIYILMVALTMVIIFAGVASVRLFKLNHSQAEKIAGLQNQLSILCTGAVGTDARILHFEQALTKLKERQNTLDLGMSSQHSYDHAIRLARKGVGINQIIDNCNLSDEEAHLISRLHGTRDLGSSPEIH
jgi:hypothetical protein